MTYYVVCSFVGNEIDEYGINLLAAGEGRAVLEASLTLSSLWLRKLIHEM